MFFTTLLLLRPENFPPCDKTLLHVLYIRTYLLMTNTAKALENLKHFSCHLVLLLLLHFMHCGDDAAIAIHAAAETHSDRSND